MAVTKGATSLFSLEVALSQLAKPEAIGKKHPSAFWDLLFPKRPSNSSRCRKMEFKSFHH